MISLLLAAVLAAAPVPPEKADAVAMVEPSLGYCIMNATRDERLAPKGPPECVGWGEHDCLDQLQSDAPEDVLLCARAERDVWIAKTDAYAEALAAAAPNARAAARIRAAHAAWVTRRDRAARSDLAGVRATSKLCAARYGYLVGLADG